MTLICFMEAGKEGDYIRAVGYAKLLIHDKSKAVAYQYASMLKIPAFFKKVAMALGFELAQKPVMVRQVSEEIKPKHVENHPSHKFAQKEPENHQPPPVQDVPAPFTKSKLENMSLFESLEAQPLKRKLEIESTALVKKRKLQKIENSNGK